MATPRTALKERLGKRRKVLRMSRTADTTVDTSTEQDQTNVSEIAEENKGEDETMEPAETLLKSLQRRRRTVMQKLSRTHSPEAQDLTEDLRRVEEKLKEQQQADTVTPERPSSTESRPSGRKLPPLKEDQASLRPPSSSSDQSSITKAPSGMTIREKLQARLKSKKDEAETAALAEPGRRLRRKDWASISTRFDTIEPEAEVDEADLLQRSQRIRSRWKKASSSALVQGQKVSKTEAFDFFTRVWEPETDEEQQQQQEKQPSTAEEKISSSPQAEPKPSTSSEAQSSVAEMKDEHETEIEAEEKPSEMKSKVEESVPETTDETRLLLEDFDGDDWRLQRTVPAEYIPYRTRVEREQPFYFIPTMARIPPHLKVSADSPVRHLEDEGFYVGERPPVNQLNLNLMEDRLLHEKERGSKWFGEDGTLIALPDPLKLLPCRPPVEDEDSPTMDVFYRKAVSKEFDSRYIDGSAENKGFYQLDVDIASLIFTHHSLFSREHVLVMRLTELYEEYCDRQEKNKAVLLTEKLQALKTAASYLRTAILEKEELGITDLEEARSQLNEYWSDIWQTRYMRDAELARDRLLLKSIIKTWKKVKSLREFQGYINTSVRLLIHKQASNKAQDEKIWNQEIEDELAERVQQYNSSYAQLQEQYNKDLERYKEQRKAKKEATKRQKSKKDTGDEVDKDSDDIQQCADAQILEEEELPKPEHLPVFNDEEVREEILQKALQIRRRPGEPRLVLELTKCDATATDKCPKGEQERRNDVRKHTVFVRILFNDKEVSKTLKKPLSETFTVQFGRIFPVQIIQWPETVKLQIYESGTISNILLAEIFVPIPSVTQTSDAKELEDLEFSSQHRVRYDHEAVGSGVEFSFDADGVNRDRLFTTGKLKCRVSWGVSTDGMPLIPPKIPASSNVLSALRGMDAVSALGQTGLQDKQKLYDWVVKSHLDPNHPSNAALMQLMQMADGTHNLQPPEYFRIEQLQEPFNFTTDEQIQNAPRFKLLRLREREVPEFKNYKMVAMFDKEVPKDLFTAFERRKRLADQTITREDGDTHRAAVIKFLNQVREQVMLKLRVAQHQRTLQDMVYEEQLPDISTLKLNLMYLAESRRPLRPVRKERKKVTAQNLMGTEVKILINVVRAFDLPVRTSAQEVTHPGAAPGGKTVASTVLGSVPSAMAMASGPSARGSSSTTQKEDVGQPVVRPYVEVVFQKNTLKTSVAEGPNPCWNEELQLPFRAPNDDYSSSNLQSIRDILYFHLFDEVVVDILEDERDRGTAVQQRIQRHWLGRFAIPFTTVYFHSKIEGTFRVYSPSVLLGYTHRFHGTQGEGGEGDMWELGKGQKEHTYLSIFVTIEPPLIPPEKIEGKFDTNEDERLLQYVAGWRKEIDIHFPSRQIKTSVVDMTGKLVFITRFIRAIKPPEETAKPPNSTMTESELVAQFVATIPSIDDNVLYSTICDIWSTSDQFLQMLCGDDEEHAVLLCNLFLQMGKKAWLCIGSAVPQGRTSFVLTKEENEAHWLWSATSGEHYNTRDNYCPMQAIWCLVDQENIWANIQVHEQPSEMNFNLNKTSSWKPLFNKSHPRPALSSVQPESLHYIQTSKDYVKDLEERIERTLREKIMEWRPRHLTRWNRYCTQIFREILPGMEHSKGQNATEEHTLKLKPILSSYQLSGYPLRIPYTDIATIVESVASTRMYAIETSDAEFALAVYVHPYPCNVLAVWVYAASLIRRR